MGWCTNQGAQYLGFDSSSKCGSTDILAGKKNPTTHAMNYLMAARGEFASGSDPAPLISMCGTVSSAVTWACGHSARQRCCSQWQGQHVLQGGAHTFLRISNINEAALGVKLVPGLPKLANVRRRVWICKWGNLVQKRCWIPAIF